MSQPLNIIFIFNEDPRINKNILTQLRQIEVKGNYFYSHENDQNRLQI